MSAKDTADAILRDFRTSMADTAVYTFDSEESAREVLYVMERLPLLLPAADIPPAVPVVLGHRIYTRGGNMRLLL